MFILNSGGGGYNGVFFGAFVDELMVKDIADVSVVSDTIRVEFRHKKLLKAVQFTFGNCLLNSAGLRK